MKNGHYRMVFSADGHTSDGRLQLEQGFAVGGDGSYKVEGRIAEAGNKLVGMLDIDLAPGMSPNARIEEAFHVNMHGSSDEAGFTLIGAGPLGIIVELTCHYEGEEPH